MSDQELIGYVNRYNDAAEDLASYLSREYAPGTKVIVLDKDGTFGAEVVEHIHNGTTMIKVPNGKSFVVGTWQITGKGEVT